MKTIWKFPLTIDEAQDVSMPIGAEIISVADQCGTLCLWAEVDPSAPKQQRTILIYGTGYPMGEGERRHIGSVVTGHFVRHIYESVNTKAIPRSCMIFPNGVVATFDQAGQQIAEYQGRQAEALKALRAAGYEIISAGVPGEYLVRPVATPMLSKGSL